MAKKQGKDAEKSEEKVEVVEPVQEEKPVVDAEDPEQVDDEEEDLTWMQEEEPDSSEDDDDDDDAGGSKGVPVDKHVAIKQKLKSKLKDEKDDKAKIQEENESLKERLKALEAQVAKAPAAPDKPVRPKRSAYESDEDFEAALDEHEDALIRYIPKAATATEDQTKKLQARVQRVADAVDGHVDRAAKLIERHSIDPDVYHAAQNSVKQVIGTVKQGGEEFIFNEFVERLGEGSEKVMFYVGKNKAQLNEFSRLFHEDPSGISAAMFLAEKRREIAGQKNLSSRASKPTAQLKGGAGVKANESAMRKKYHEAHAKGQNQKAFDLKRQAKAAKIDTSGW